MQGEVVNPRKSYPRALALTLPLVTLGYLIPLTATLGASDWTKWQEGGWPEIAKASTGVLGPLLAVCVALAGMVSALALFNALLLSYSRIPFAMAGDRLLPAFLSRPDARGTPKSAVIVSALCYSVFALSSFAHLVVADVLLYSMALFLEFGALIALRIREPGLRGAYRIPVGTGGVVVLAAIPVVILITVTTLELKGGEYGFVAILAALGAAALGLPLYFWASRTLRVGFEEPAR